MMFAALIVRSGPLAGRRQALGDGQSVDVGGSDWADFAVRSDVTMASKHFALINDAKSCRIRALDSRNGTFVNGQPITEHTLQHGDIIVAGRTEFEIRIEIRSKSQFTLPKSSEPMRTGVAARRGTANDAPKPTVLRSGHARTLRFERLVHPNGHTLLAGRSRTTDPCDVIRATAQQYNCFLIVDLSFVGTPLPPDAGEVLDLLDGLPASVRGEHQLRLLTAESKLLPLAAQWRGKDALICLFSQEAPEGVRRTVRSSLGAFSRPSSLRNQMAVRGRIPALLGGAAAALIETEDGEGWEVHVNPLQGDRFRL